MTMNEAILQAITDLNKFKSLGYKWPANIDGSIGDVLYKGKVILKGNPDNFTYCCGLVLQGYLKACDKIGKDLGTPEEVMSLRRKWFIAENVKKPIYLNGGSVDALIELGFAHRIELKDLEAGDIIQFWRASGSGHNVIGISTYTENGYRALKYWSTQPATNGIGYRTEYFEGVKNPITQVHICRPI